MSTPVKLLAFALGLAAVFGAALGLGALVGPAPAAPAPAAHGDDGGHADEAAAAPADVLPAGLQISEDGYSLDLAAATAPAGAAVPVSFRVLGPDGQPVTRYEEAHEEELHLVAVRRDSAGYQHVHPVLGDGGVWTTDLALSPGSWRLFADFVPAADGENRILGADLAVAGSYEPAPLPAPSVTAQVDDYTVTLDGSLVPGEESELTLSVARDGRPVTDLQPYLGAYGHLVVLRTGDLGYLHVHPLGEPGEVAAGPDVEFATTAPSAGTYRLFLDFRHGGVVRTAAFTVTVPEEGRR